MKLFDLIPESLRLDLNENHDVHGITSHSQSVAPGMIFVAVSGYNQDGSLYIPNALENGACLIVAEETKKEKISALLSGDVSAIVWVKNSREMLSALAKKFYKDQPANISAVTGTSGKSSTVWFVRQILEGLGLSAASLGTIGLHAGTLFEKSSLTTADPMTLHKTLQNLSQRQVEYIAMEASSIGIEQCRMDGVRLNVAAFTNLSHEHLDYHETMEGYFRAKQRLFTHCLDRDGYAVLNADITEYTRLKDTCAHHKLKTIPYGIHAEGEGAIRLINRAVTDDGQTVTFSIEEETFSVDLPLIGAFQAQNVLCALAMVHGLLERKTETTLLNKILPTLKTVPGRLERIDGHPDGAKIYVDYAHKPDALKAVLNAVRPHTKGKLWLVFGCGGDRDRAKRSIMGQIAYDLADQVVVTDDNPRTETPEAIRAEIASGFTSFHNIGNRREALDLAISSLQSGDSLIIAGKGHESGQIIHAQTLPFDDRDEARHAIKKCIDKHKDTKK